MAQKRKDWNGLISGFKASDLVFLDESGCNTDMTRRSPGCGSQRLLRCRSHPAGRGPNSSSLFPPLAAVVAVAPCRGGFGSPRKVNGFTRGSPTRGAGAQRLRGCTKTGLPSVARPALLRHITPQASSRKLTGLPMAPPLGATATTAASGGNREELLGPRPAGCERQRSRRWEPQPGQWRESA